ncbi:MAP kinase-activated protein kinase 2 (Fragment) [Seminavis robusta]|uniref:MAP kinase-activated protein kinase 2 n=1 Tax=Seminavis robusta TaxID=568900 RepID=A0A9N8HLC2_9STRA
MGACLSAAGGGGMLIENPDGDEEGFHKRFLEDHVLGEGEFGVVKMVHDMRSQENEPLACKTLRKGVVFKDNVLYAPLKPEILKGEINMLRALAADKSNFCLKLHSIYETPRLILMVTELCAGGEMMEYVAKQEDDLRTEDVSRIAFQLLTAFECCAKHHIIHRDVKPENIMFLQPTPKSELRVIDFGSGVMDDPNAELEEGAEFGRHTTFAGSAFYISPEMFQRTYTKATDIWSVGVTLYVLVAGYPADQLQKAFNILQTSKNRDLKKLPNLPEDMPASYYEMLEGLLVYRHKRRKTAAEMLTHEFVTFHKDLEEEEDGISIEAIAAAAAAAGGIDPEKSSASKKMGRSQSIKLSGSVQRHTLMLGYQKFERSVTTLLATMLDGNEFDRLIKQLDDRKKPAETNASEPSAPANNNEPEGATTNGTGPTDESNETVNRERLDIIPMHTLKKIVKEDYGKDDVLDMISKLPNANDYNTFAYHTPLLKEFVSADAAGGTKRRSSKNGGDHTNPRVVRRGTYVADKLVNRAGSLRDLTSRSDGDEPKGKQGSFRKLLNGSGTGPRARRAQLTHAQSAVR